MILVNPVQRELSRRLSGHATIPTLDTRFYLLHDGFRDGFLYFLIVLPAANAPVKDWVGGDSDSGVAANETIAFSGAKGRW